jgi:hypothetical protein
VRAERARRIDHRAVQSIFSHLDRLVPVPAHAPLATNPLAQTLTFGEPPVPHFPAQLAVPSGRLSYDTPENRFIKHVLNKCLAYRFVDHPAHPPWTPDGLQNDAWSSGEHGLRVVFEGGASDQQLPSTDAGACEVGRVPRPVCILGRLVGARLDA